jgi:phosphoribosylformylglycinamidine synthase I
VIPEAVTGPGRRRGPTRGGGGGPAGRAGSHAPRALVITGDGLNCERETALAFQLAGARPELVHITDILRGERRLREFQLLALIGGFANGDHLGAGTVQAGRFRHRLRGELERFVEEQRPIIGICNGFQTLVKMGLLPAFRQRSAPSLGGIHRGADPWERTATLMSNDSGRFEDRWVHLRVEPASPCVWTAGIERLYLPVRHGEGRFHVRDSAVLDHLEAAGQIVLRYCDREGRPTQRYPWNPNGSLAAVAGICDATGTIFGLMPHPEAFLSPYNHPSWTRAAATGRPLPPEGQGLALFRNVVEHLRRRGG